MLYVSLQVRYVRTLFIMHILYSAFTDEGNMETRSTLMVRFFFDISGKNFQILYTIYSHSLVFLLELIGQSIRIYQRLRFVCTMNAAAFQEGKDSNEDIPLVQSKGDTNENPLSKPTHFHCNCKRFVSSTDIKNKKLLSNLRVYGRRPFQLPSVPPTKECVT